MRWGNDRQTPDDSVHAWMPVLSGGQHHAACAVMIGLALTIARAKLGQAFTWLTASALHLTIALCAVLGIWGLYQRGQATKWHDIAVERLTALKSAEQAKREAEAKSATLAKDNNHAHETRLAGDLDTTRRFIAANRVRQCPASGSGGQDQNPGVPDEAAHMHLVVGLPESDVTSCAANHAYAMSSFEWAQGLVKDGLAEK